MPAICLTPECIAARNAKVKRTNHKLVVPLGNKLASSGPSAGLLSTDDSMMVAAFVISTPNRDRGGDEMNPLGCVLDNYKMNPVVMFNHGIEGGGPAYPIGMAREKIGGDIWVYPEPNRVWSKVKFTENVAEGPQCYALIK